MNSNTDQSGFFCFSPANTGEKNAHFSGIGYTDNAVVIGLDGYNTFIGSGGSALGIRDGRFSLFFELSDRYIAYTDPYGMDTLFYYQGEDCWAVSNSFKRLADSLRQKRIKLTAHYPGISTFMIKHSFGCQLATNNTAISEIKVLPLGFYLSIKNKKIEVRPISEIHPPRPERKYQDILIDFVQKWRARLSALQVAFEKIQVDLSGGMDSRIVFGLAHSANLDPDKFNIRSDEKKPQDLKIANELAGSFGRKLNTFKIPHYKSNPEDQFKLYMDGNLGVYAPIYRPMYTRPLPFLHLHGGCGEFYRKFYTAPNMASLLPNCTQYLTDDLYRELQRDVQRYFRDAGVNINGSFSTIHHYRNFRGRFHFGRNAFRSLSEVIITPLASVDLIEASMMLDENELANGHLIRDLFLLIEPKLLETDFDDPEKSFDLKDSPFYGSKRPVLPDFPVLQVYGSYAQVDDQEHDFRDKRTFRDCYIQAGAQALANIYDTGSRKKLFNDDLIKSEMSDIIGETSRCSPLLLAGYLADIGALK